MILTHGEPIEVKNSAGQTVAALFVDNENNLQLVPRSGQLNNIRIGSDSSGNPAIQINTATGDVHMYGNVYVNGVRL